MDVGLDRELLLMREVEERVTFRTDDVASELDGDVSMLALERELTRRDDVVLAASPRPGRDEYAKWRFVE